jgi:hypothetical protein
MCNNLAQETLQPGQFEQRRNGTRRTSRTGDGLVARRSRSVLRSLSQECRNEP